MKAGGSGTARPSSESTPLLTADRDGSNCKPIATILLFGLVVALCMSSSVFALWYCLRSSTMPPDRGTQLQNSTFKLPGTLPDIMPAKESHSLQVDHDGNICPGCVIWDTASGEAASGEAASGEAASGEAAGG